LASVFFSFQFQVAREKSGELKEKEEYENLNKCLECHFTHSIFVKRVNFYALYF
jgi:hypothetical protein